MCTHKDPPIYSISWYEFDSCVEYLFTHKEIKTQDEFKKDFEGLMIELADSVRANYGEDAQWPQVWFDYVIPRMERIGYARYYRTPCEAALVYDGFRISDTDFRFIPEDI